MGRIASVVPGACGNILQLAELIVDGHRFRVLNHIIVTGPVVGRVFGLDTEESFYVVQSPIERSSGRPSSCGATGKVEAVEKASILFSNSAMGFFAWHG